MPQRLELPINPAANGVAVSWLDQLATASFRGVDFQVDSIDWSAGEHVVVREYPFQELPTIFSMGAATQELKFSAYVIGDDYHQQRDALMAVLQGEGLLRHPTAGMLRVAVAGKYSLKEAPTAEGGMARFELHFVLAEQRRYPSGAPATQAVATEVAEQAKEQAAAQFAAAWSVANKPGWVAEAAVGRVQEALAGVTGRITAATSTLTDYTATTLASYEALRTGLDELVRAPRRLADAVVQLATLPEDLPRAAARDLRAAFEWAFTLPQRLPQRPFETVILPAQPKPGLPDVLVIYGTALPGLVGPASAARRELLRLQRASDRLLQTLALAAWVQTVAAVELPDYAASMQLRGTLVDQVRRLMLDGSEDGAPAAMHDALAALQTAALADLQTRSRDLVRLSSYTPQGWQPVLYVSHKLYGTGAYADEILALNPHIRHPLLVPPGRPLRVLDHG